MDYDFKVYPATLDPKDYWRQVKRTVNGVPVSQVDIDMIVHAIRRGLRLESHDKDKLLDIGCGNGALSAMFFENVSSFLGVDYSEFLISVAKRDFERIPEFRFQLSEARAFLLNEPNPLHFNKVLCYGCFSYFPDAENLLKLLRDRFSNIERVFIGNLPDLDKARHFFRYGQPSACELTDPDSKIGIWRTKAEFYAMAQRANWNCQFKTMPKSFYASHYRYDAILTPVV